MMAKITTNTQAARAARVQALQSHEITRLARRLDGRYEKSAVTFDAVSAGRNQVQINGGLYPAEGVDGQGGAIAVVNVGTPAVARYAPSNRRSVVAVAGTGAGGSGGGGGDGGGGGSYAPTPHELGGPHHTGLLPWTMLNKAGSSLAQLTSRDHSMLEGVTADQHHNQQHALVGADHTASGLTVGHTVRATGPTTFAWQQLQHDDLGGVTPNQHHNQVHNIVGTDHVIAGNQFQVVGATANNVLGLLTPTHNPGAAAALLRTDNNGSLILDTNLFVVNAPGNVVSIDTNLFYANADNNWIGINRPPSGATLDIIATANADHTQRIKQKNGQTGRMWRIEDKDGNELIVLDSVGNLQSGRPGFYSGLTGWQITPTGNAEFNNIWARGELHATVFVKDEVHASGGTLLVATAGKMHSDAYIDASTTDNEELQVLSTAAAFPGTGLLPLTIQTTSSTFDGTTLFTEGIGNFIEIDDPPSGPALYFQPGEILRVKTEINEEGNPLRLSDLWLEVTNGTQDDGFSRYSVTKRSGSDSTIPAGTGVVSYGQRGDGRILMTSDLNYAPYIDVFTTGQNPWAGGPGDIIPRMRMGQLMGVGVPGVSGVSQYGIIMGSDLSDANAGYLIASNLQLALYKVPFRVNNGIADTGLWSPDGNIRIGKNIAHDVTTGFAVYTTGAREGDVVIGNEATGNFLRWQQATGTMTVSGSLIVDDPGTTVTSKYVDDQDRHYDSLAQGYGNTGRDAAKDYADNRRVIKVTGSWESTGPNTIRWGNSSAVQIHFAKGAARTISQGQTATLSAGRTYLFVDLGVVSGNLTIIESQSVVINNPNYVLVAVCDPGPQKASVSVVAGTTYISGSNIATQSISANRIVSHSITANEIEGGTITANEIAANAITTVKLDALAVTAGKIDALAVTSAKIAAGAVTAVKIDALAVTTDKIAAGAVTANKITVDGNIDISTTGAIRGNAKAWGSNTPGFFLGYNNGAYRFDIGNNANFLRWNGSALQLKTKEAILFEADASNVVLIFSNAGSAAQLSYNGGPNSELVFTGQFRTLGNLATGNSVIANGEVRGGNVVSTGPVIQISQARLIGASSSGGKPGEIGWDANYIYICVSTDLWRRIPIPSTTW